MPRSLFRDSIMVKGPGGAIPLAGATVNFYQDVDGPNPPAITFPLFPDETSVVPLDLPYITGDLGELEVWADQPHRVRIIASKFPLDDADERIDLDTPPGQGATVDQIQASVAAHEARTDDPHRPAGYLTQATADPRYLQQAQADLRYQQSGQKGQANGYAPLDSGALIPPQYLPAIAITDTFVVASQAEMLALTAQTGDVCIRTDTGKSYILAANDPTVLANWKELSAAAPVQSVNGYTGVVTLAAHDVGAVALAGDTMTGALVVPSETVAGKPLVVSPAAGNILTWDATGLLASLATANVTVVARQEFSPTAGTTAVTLSGAPTAVLQVARNGVEQSAALGHYALAGSTLTFQDAFAAGEQVIVLSSQGTSVVTDSYTTGQADARFVNVTGDTMTGALNLGNNTTVAGLVLNGPVASTRGIVWQSAGNPRWRLQTREDATGEGTPDYGANLWLTADWTGGSGGAQDVVAFGRNAGDTHFANSVYFGVPGGDINALAPLQVTTAGQLNWSPAGSLLNGGQIQLRSGVGGNITVDFRVQGASQALYNVLLNGTQRWGPGGSTATDTTLQRTGAGALRLSGATNSMAEVRSSAGTAGARFGQVVAGARADLTVNASYDGTNWNRDDTALGAIVIGANPSSPFSVSYAPSGANPVGAALVTKLTVAPTGTLTLTPDANQWAEVIQGTTTSAQSYGLWIKAGTGTGDVGLQVNKADNSRTMLNLNGAGTLTLTPDATVRALTASGECIVLGGKSWMCADPTNNYFVGWRCSTASPRTMVMSYDGGDSGVQIDTNGMMRLVTLTNITGNALNINGPSTGVNLNMQGWGSVLMSHMGGGWTGPISDNAYNTGTPSSRWSTVYATNGTIQTSTAESKTNLAALDPGACAQAVLDTEWLSFEYLPPDRDERDDDEGYARRVASGANARRQNGYVLGHAVHKAHALFGLGDRRSKNNGSDLGIVACALQAALQRIAALEARLG